VRRRRAAGFTFVEMLAVMILIGILVSGVASFYIQLSRESNAAAEAMRGARRTTAVLDRIARDLEGAILVVKPDAVDPLDHPWVFFAERARGGSGADRLRFTTRSHRPRASAAHESDLAVVAYALREDEEGGAELVRWSSPRLPEGLDRRVPHDERDGAQVLIDDVLEFGVRFLSEEGDWKDGWDSSSIVDSSRLPLAAEIRLALAAAPDAAPEPEVEAAPLSRQVVLPLRPLDLETLLASAESEEEEQEEEEEEEEEGEGAPETAAEDGEQTEEQECITVSQCVAAHPEIDVGAALAAAGLPRSMLSAAGGQCASDFANIIPIPADCR
jgi:prepilin-type N-terminal cleavage/methylation domain-containing protein